MPTPSLHRYHRQRSRPYQASVYTFIGVSTFSLFWFAPVAPSTDFFALFFGGIHVTRSDYLAIGFKELSRLMVEPNEDDDLTQDDWNCRLAWAKRRACWWLGGADGLLPLSKKRHTIWIEKPLLTSGPCFKKRHFRVKTPTLVALSGQSEYLQFYGIPPDPLCPYG